MNIKELFEHITSHMTAEQALMKLLEGNALTYEHLKFNEGDEIHPLMVISMAALDMGWDLAIPDGRDDDEVQGMAVGTDEYLSELFDTDDCDNGDCDCEEVTDNSRFDEAVKLLQYFVDRVDAGTIRSKTTYTKYKSFLDKFKTEK